MKFRFLNKTIEHQRFEYRPMYYDERKERLERKKEQFSSEKSAEKSNRLRSEDFKDQLKEGWSRAQYRETQRRTSNMRIMLLIGLILALGYFIFNGVDEVDTVVTKLW